MNGDCLILFGGLFSKLRQILRQLLSFWRHGLPLTHLIEECQKEKNSPLIIFFSEFGNIFEK
jgi:hypothetical protein